MMDRSQSLYNVVLDILEDTYKFRNDEYFAKYAIHRHMIASISS
jgi:hypothetical protein